MTQQKLLAFLPASWLAPIDLIVAARCGHPALTDGSEAMKDATTIIMSHVLSDDITTEPASEVFWRWQARSLKAAMQVLALHRPLVPRVSTPPARSGGIWPIGCRQMAWVDGSPPTSGLAPPRIKRFGTNL